MDSDRLNELESILYASIHYSDAASENLQDASNMDIDARTMPPPPQHQQQREQQQKQQQQHQHRFVSNKRIINNATVKPRYWAEAKPEEPAAAITATVGESTKSQGAGKNTPVEGQCENVYIPNMCVSVFVCVCVYVFTPISICAFVRFANKEHFFVILKWKMTNNIYILNRLGPELFQLKLYFQNYIFKYFYNKRNELRLYCINYFENAMRSWNNGLLLCVLWS